jgi:hypothetical protein
LPLWRIQISQPCLAGASRQVWRSFNARSKSLRPQSDSRRRSLAPSDLLPLPKQKLCRALGNV